MSWLDMVACRCSDAGLFFGADDETQPEKEARERKAKAICAPCPVRAQCLDYALSRSIKHGIWGGLTEHERSVLRRRGRVRYRSRRPSAALPAGAYGP
jgi:WhiB family transcriptional regulator, redox-sensing transcriptional regulator